MNSTNVKIISCTDLRLYFHKVCLTINRTFLPLHDTLYAGRVKLYAEASQIFKQVMCLVGFVDSKSDKTFNVQIFAGRVMARAFWDSGEMLLLELLEKAATIDIQTYLPTLKKLTLRIRRILPNRKINQVHLLPYDKAKPHSSLRTREAITAIGWIIIPHPLCRTDLKPTIFNQFGPLNDELQGRHFAEDDELQHSL